MAGRKSDFVLPTLDDLFSTQEMRDEQKLARIRDIPIELIDNFPDHPFKVRDDEDMTQLVESIKERGVITPATVRPKDDGRYELVSGHRRKRACELAGMDTLRCEVVELTRDEATILMVESNFQRSQILPSEKAFAYLGTETVSWVCILGAAPFAALGFLKYNGMTAEKFICTWVKSEFIMPKRLTFRATNTYYELMKPSMEKKTKEAMKSND